MTTNVITPATIINLLEDGLDPVVYSGLLDSLEGISHKNYLSSNIKLIYLSQFKPAVSACERGLMIGYTFDKVVKSSTWCLIYQQF